MLLTSVSKLGFSLMNCACKGQNVAAIKQLTLLGSKICIDYSFSPVNYAVRSNNVDLLNFLVDHGVNIKDFQTKFCISLLLI